MVMNTMVVEHSTQHEYIGACWHRHANVGGCCRLSLKSLSTQNASCYAIQSVLPLSCPCLFSWVGGRVRAGGNVFPALSAQPRSSRCRNACMAGEPSLSLLLTLNKCQRSHGACHRSLPVQPPPLLSHPPVKREECMKEGYMSQEKEQAAE